MYPLCGLTDFTMEENLGFLLFSGLDQSKEFPGSFCYTHYTQKCSAILGMWPYFTCGPLMDCITLLIFGGHYRLKF